jgi:hypothetical protein
MESDAQRLKQGCLNILQPIWHRETRARGHMHPLAKAAAIGIVAAEMEAPAEVGMSLLTQFATAARLGGIDRDARSRRKRFEIPVFASGSNRLDDAGKFVTENKRRLDTSRSNARIVVGMQVASAHARSLYPQKHFARPGRAGMRNLLHAKVGRTVQASGEHVRKRIHSPQSRVHSLKRQGEKQVIDKVGEKEVKKRAPRTAGSFPLNESLRRDAPSLFRQPLISVPKL